MELTEAEFSAPKTGAFLDNIVQPYSTKRVTIDFHAYSVAVDHKYTVGGDTSTETVPNIGITDYAKLEKAYRIAAAHLDIHPQRLQHNFVLQNFSGITWGAWRRIHNSTEIEERITKNHRD